MTFTGSLGENNILFFFKGKGKTVLANATEEPKDGFQAWLDPGPQTMSLMFFFHLTKGLLPNALESLLGQVSSQDSKDTHSSCAPQKGAAGAFFKE